MQSEKLINDLKQLLSAADVKQVISSLLQDEMVLISVLRNDVFQQVVEKGGSQMINWSPANIGLVSVFQATHPQADELNTEDMISIDGQILNRAERVLEDYLRSPGMPETLQEACLLSLALREQYRHKNNWKEVIDSIQNSDLVLNANWSNMWKTVFACLYGMVPQPIEMLKTLLVNTPIDTSIDIISHIILSNPHSQDEQVNLFSKLMQELGDSKTTRWLQYLNLAAREDLVTDLANLLLTQHSDEIANPMAFSSRLVDFSSAMELAGQYFNRANVCSLSGQFESARVLFEEAKNTLKECLENVLVQLITIDSSQDGIDIRDILSTSLIGQEKLNTEVFLSIPSKHLSENDFDVNQSDASGALLKIRKAGVMSKNEDYSTARSMAKEAVAEYLADINNDPQNVYPKMMMKWDPSEYVQILSDLDLNEDAKKISEKFISSRPLDGKLHNQISKLNCEADDLEKARQHGSLATMLDDSNPEYHRQYALIHEKMGNWTKAFDERKQILSLTSTPEVEDWLSFARSALNINQNRLAMEACQVAIERQPENGQAHSLAARAMIKTNKSDEAIEHLQTAIDLIPADEDNWLLLAEIYDEKNQTHQALDLLRASVINNADSAGLNYQLAKTCKKSGLLSEALHYARIAQAKDSSQTDYSLLTGQVLQGLGNLHDAEKVIKKALEKDQNQSELNYEYGKIKMELGQHAEALPYLEKSLNEKHEDADRFVAYANALGGGKSLQYFKSVVDVPLLGKIERILQHALKISPDNFLASMMMAEIELGRNNEEKSFEYYQKIAESSGKENASINQRVKQGLGQAALAVNKIDTALVALQESAEIQPDHVEVNRMLTDAYLQSELFENAYHTALKTMEHSKDDAEKLEWFVDVMVKLDEYEKAIKALEKLVNLEPDRYEHSMKLVELMLDNGNEKSARSILDHLCQNGKIFLNDRLLQKAGKLYQILGDDQTASECFRQGLEVSLHNKGELVKDVIDIYEKTRTEEDLFEFLQSVRIDYPQEIDIDVTLAESLAKMGEIDEALAIVDEAINLYDSKILDASCLDHKPEDVEKSEQKNEKRFDLSGVVIGLFARAAIWAEKAGILEKALVLAQKAIEHTTDNLVVKYIYANIVCKLSIDIQTNDFVSLLSGWIEDGMQEVKAGVSFTFIEKICLLELICMRAEISINLGKEDVDKAAYYIKAAEEISNNFAYPHVLLMKAIFLAKNGDLDEAAAIVENAGTAKEEFEEGYLVNIETGSLEEWLAQAIRKEWEVSTGDIYLYFSNWDKAFDVYQAYLENHGSEPRSALAALKSIVVAAEEQRFCMDTDCLSNMPGEQYLDESRYQDFKAIQSQINESPVREELLRWQARGEMVFKPSVKHIDLFNRFKMKADDVCSLLMGLRSCGEYEAGTKFAQGFMGDTTVKLQVALNYLQDRSIEGLNFLQDAITQIQKDPRYHYVMARLAFLANDVVLGFQEISSALEVWEDEPHWQRLAAEIANSLHKIDKKIYHLQKAYELQPDDFTGVLSLGQSYLEIGQIDQGIKVLEEYRVKQPQHYDVLMLLSRAYHKAGNLAKALELAQNASKIETEESEAVLKSAELALEMGRLKLATDYGIQAYEKCNGCSDAAQFLVNLYEKTGETDKALKIVDQEISNGNVPVETHLLKIRLMKNQKDDELLPEIKKVARLFPDNDEVLLSLAEALADNDQLDEAKEAIQKGLRRNPEHAALNMMLGDIHRQHGQLDQAIYCISKAIEKNSQNDELYVKLGDIYFERRENSKAIQAYREAVKRKADNYCPYYKLAMVLKDSKDYISAEAMLRKALELEPNDVDIRKQLGAIIALNLVHNSQEMVMN